MLYGLNDCQAKKTAVDIDCFCSLKLLMVA